RPVVAGQSWGGNVVLDLGAHHPDLMRGLVLVDGGYIEMQLRPEATWEQISVQLRPPDLVGTPYAQMLQRMQNFHPEWSEEGILDTLENFERMADDTVRPWLLLSRHMQILRALWEHRPSQLYPLVTAPVLICVAEDARSPERMQMKRAQVELAQSALAHATVQWFPATDHDIHVHRPQALAQLMLSHFEHVER
ncbi:MAG: alpha/beta hydrolase, partial [Caldilineaceae bacterium]|nr:alpha/beta hydrolase [Caldilineaceae bacterium]